MTWGTAVVDPVIGEEADSVLIGLQLHNLTRYPRRRF